MPNDPIDDLLQVPVFDSPGPHPQFFSAVDSCLRVLRQRFPRYAEFLDQRTGNLAKGRLESLEQVAALPAVFLPVLKTYRFTVPPEVPIVVRLTSSGTTGTPSLVPLDEPSMRRRVAAMTASYRGLGILRRPMNALGFLLDPTTTQMAGSVVIDAVLRSNPEIHSVCYLARMGAAGPDFALPAAVAAINEAREKGPVLLVGYPALIAAAIQGLTSQGIKRLPLPEGSSVLTGGGWKSFLPGINLDRHEFQQLATAFFDIPPAAIRDMYGLSECPAVFVQCAGGNYHIPCFAWAQAIDPETGREAPDGETGLLQLTVPLTTSYPLLKILTTDKVRMGQGCPCGLAAPVMTPQGRVTAARFETCAMKIGRAVA